MSRKIPFFNYSALFQESTEEIMEVMNDVMGRGAYIMQKDLINFEENLATYSGAKHSVGVANATDGLQLALMAAGIGSNNEVIISSHTMVATASAIHFAGAVPVPVETGKDHLIDSNAIEAAITPLTMAIMPTQLNGRTANMDEIQAIADKHGLMIFEDSAQALGSKFKGRCAGTFGVASCISFYPAKILGCLGDGGAVLTNDEEVYQKLLMLRDHGREETTGDVGLWGFNSRLDNLQAAFLDVQFKEYQQVIDRRRALANLYQKRLRDLDELLLPPAPDSDPDHFDVYQNYEIEAEQRDELKAFLANNGVGTLIAWGGKAVHQFRKLGFTQSLPFTDQLFERILMLPMSMSLSDDDVHYVCDRIREFYDA